MQNLLQKLFPSDSFYSTLLLSSVLDEISRRCALRRVFYILFCWDSFVNSYSKVLEHFLEIIFYNIFPSYSPSSKYILFPKLWLIGNFFSWTISLFFCSSISYICLFIMLSGPPMSYISVDFLILATLFLHCNKNKIVLWLFLFCNYFMTPYLSLNLWERIMLGFLT